MNDTPLQRPESRTTVSLWARLLALVERLGSRRAHWAALAFGLLLVTPSIGSRFVFDDNTHALMKRADRGVAGVHGGWLDLFVFVSGDPEKNRAMIDQGSILPWWALESLKLSFLRPLSSLTHLLDDWLWPSSAALMHVHSILWYALLLVTVLAVYRRLLGSAPTAGLAFLLYAIDDAHAQTVAWIANRNALIASIFALAALICHDRFRRQGQRTAAFAAPLLFLIGLLGAEFAVGIAAYFIAYALCLDRGSTRARLLSLVPYAAVLVAWRVVSRMLGYGVRGSDAYIDPGAEPLVFLAALPKRVMMLVLGQFGAPGADTAFWKPPSEHWLLWLLAGLTVLLVGWLSAPLLRRDDNARFWALGALLAMVPVSASFSSDRVLLLVGVGAFALLAKLFVHWLERGAAGERIGGPRAAVLAGYAGLHLMIAPLMNPIRARFLELAGAALDRADAGIPSDPSIRDKTLVVANAPVDAFIGFLQVMRERRGVPRPAHVYSLSSATSPIELTRHSERVLRVRPERGYLYTESERFWRGARHPLSLGQRIELSTMTAVVVELTADGRPAAVDFLFHGPLDSSVYAWVFWQDGRYTPFVPPPVGQSVRFPAQDFVEILIAEALR